MTEKEDPVQQFQQERAYLSARLEEATRELTRLDLLNLELTLQKGQALAAFRFIEILHEQTGLSATVDDLYDTVVEIVTTDLSVDMAALLRVDLRTRCVSALAAVGLPDSAKALEPAAEIRRQTFLEPAFVNSQSPLDAFSLFVRDQLGAPYFIWYPIVEEGDDALVLFAGNRTENLVSKQPFSQASLEIYGAISSALLLRRDQTFRLAATSETLAEKSRLLAAFQRIGELILSSLDLEQILDDLARQIVQAGIFRSIMIALVDESRHWVEVVRSITWQPEEKIDTATDSSATIGRRYDLDDDNITAEVARTGRMCVIDGDDRRFDRRVTPSSASTPATPSTGWNAPTIAFRSPLPPFLSMQRTWFPVPVPRQVRTRACR